MDQKGKHPNSLKNLSLPKGRKEGYGHYYTLPQPLIDKLFVCVAEDGMSIEKAAKEVGISFPTAKKYFEEGDKRRGIKPLRRRLLVYKEKVSETFDRGLIKRKKELLKIVQKAILKIGNQIESDDGGAVMKKVSLSQLDKLIRLEVFLSGQGQVKEKELLSAEDLQALDRADGFNKTIEHKPEENDAGQE